VERDRKAGQNPTRVVVPIEEEEDHTQRRITVGKTPLDA